MGTGSVKRPWRGVLCVRHPWWGVLCVLYIISNGFNSASGLQKDYSRYQVLQIHTEHPGKVTDLQEYLTDNGMESDVWRWPSSEYPHADMMIHGDDIPQIHVYMISNQIDYHVKIENVQRFMDVAQSSGAGAGAMSGDTPPTQELCNVSTAILHTYATYTQITEWLESLTSRFPHLVTLETIGYTSEERPILLAKISMTSSITNKSSIWINGGIHAREWISPAAALYVIYILLHGYITNDSTMTSLLEEVDWYILPVLNPDGYEYSHTDERLWRKNRSPENNGCRGVDLNRNWPYKWDPPVGRTSTDPCSWTYRGISAGSELETQAVTRFIHSLSTPLNSFIDVHSYSQKWLVPLEVKDGPTNLPVNILSRRVIRAMAGLYDTVYHAGFIGEAIYAASGDSASWGTGNASVRYSFVVELRDTGYYGFLLPIEQIIPTAEELWTAVKIVALQVLEDKGHTFPVNHTANRTSSEEVDLCEVPRTEILQPSHNIEQTHRDTINTMEPLSTGIDGVTVRSEETVQEPEVSEPEVPSTVPEASTIVTGEEQNNGLSSGCDILKHHSFQLIFKMVVYITYVYCS